MVENLQEGMRLHAMYSDGEFYPATVVTVSTTKKRAKAPVKVHFEGFGDEHDTWLDVDSLKSKQLSKPKAKAKSKAAAKAKSKTTAKGFKYKGKTVDEILQTTTAEKREDGTYVVKIGILGGSGMDNPDLLQEREEIDFKTPFGKTSDKLVCGKIEGVPVVLCGRHGKKHTLMPGNVPFRANVFAFKALGCTHMVVSTACGILREGIAPGELVLLDQFIDRTQKRIQTFYDGRPGSPAGVAHMPMATPFCAETGQIVKEAADELGVKMHPKGTMVSIEGPRFSSRAESNFFRLLKADTINMTTVPEVVLAVEAGLLYCSIAMATDYDCWKEDEEHVDVAKVLAVMKGNSDNVLKVWKKAIPAISAKATTGAIEAQQAQAKNNIMGVH